MEINDKPLPEGVIVPLALQRQISEMARDSMDCRKEMLAQVKRINNFIEKFEPYLERAVIEDARHTANEAEIEKLKSQAQSWGVKGAAGFAVVAVFVAVMSFAIAVGLQFHHYLTQTILK